MQMREKIETNDKKSKHRIRITRVTVQQYKINR